MATGAVPPVARPWIQFVSTMTNRSRSGSIHIDVPVKPVCPNARTVRNRPQLPPPEHVSQPRARQPGPGVVKSRTVVLVKNCMPDRSEEHTSELQSRLH